MSEKDPLGLFNTNSNKDPLGIDPLGLFTAPDRVINKADTFESNLLSPLMGMSRAVGALFGKGGVSQEAHADSVREAEAGAQQNPWSAMGGQAAAALGPLVAGAGPLAIPAMATGGAGLTALGGMGAGIVGGGMAAPIVGPQAGMQEYQSKLNAGAPQEEAESAGQIAGGIAAATNLIPTYGNLVPRMIQGALLNTGTDAASKALVNTQISNPKLHSNPFDPESLAKAALIGSVTEGVGGNRKGERLLAKDEVPNVPKVKTDVEQKLLEQHYQATTKNLEAEQALHAQLENIIREGDASPEVIALLKDSEAKIIHFEDTLDKLSDIKSGKADASAKRTADRIKAEALRRERMAGSENRGPVQLAPHEDAPVGELPPNFREKVGEFDPTTGEILVTKEAQPAVAEPKISPVEVALERIAKATEEPQLAARWMEQAERKIQELTNREGTEPGADYSSIKESLRQEVAAYKDILEGKQPNLDWFNNKQVEPTTDLVTTKTTLDTPKEPLFRTEEQSWDAATKDKHEAGSTLDALVKIEKEWAPYKQERDALIDKPNKTLADDLRIAELNDIYNELALKHNPRNELKDIVDSYKEELRDLEDIKVEDPEYYSARKGIVEEQLRKFNLFEQKATDLVKNPDKITSAESIIKDVDADNYAPYVREMENNKQLFDVKPDSNVYIDKAITREFGSDVANVIHSLLEKTQLGKEKVFFVLRSDDVGFVGRTTLTGNDIVIQLSKDKLAARLADTTATKFFKAIPGGAKLAEAIRDFNVARVASHEIGHAAFFKYLRDTVTHTDDLHAMGRDFDKLFKKDIGVTSLVDIGKEDKVIDYQKSFNEFFAERVTRTLLHQHLFNSFAGGKLQDIKTIVDSSLAYLKRKKVDVDRKTFTDTIINDILTGSQDYIKQTSAEAAFRVTLRHNDEMIMKTMEKDFEAFPFAGSDLETTRRLVQNDFPDWFDKKASSADDMRDPQWRTPLSMRSVRALGHGLTRSLFGKVGVARIFRDNPLIGKVHNIIRNAELRADEINNRLWFNSPSKAAWEKAGVVAKFKKVATDASAYMQLKKAKPEDLTVVHDLFQKGFDNTLDYVTNKTQNGQHLTIQQAKLYDTFAKLFEEQYNEAVKVQQGLGKKNILPKRDGWYPSVRTGEYFVDISFNGNSIHREHFRSPTEARTFINNYNQTGAKHLTISEPQKMSETKQVSDMYGGVDLAQKILAQRFPSASPAIQKALGDALTAIQTKGGKLGTHHNFRSNLTGYKGTELFYTAKERGESFRKAIQQSVQDYSGGIRKMLIQHNVDPILKNPNNLLDPDMKATAQQMVDSALGRVDAAITKPIDDFIKNTWDAGVHAVTGEIKANDRGSFNRFHQGTLELFYLTRLMSKFVFPIGQIATFATAARELSYSGGFFGPYMGMAKGITKLVTGNKELRDVLYQVSQKSNTFEPQFIESMHLEDSSKTMENIKSWVLLQKVNEGADALSRVLTFSSAYEMYRSKGIPKQEAIIKAMDDTNSTMVPYGRTETAPIFNKLGLFGQSIKPLQTFGQQSLANFISDFRHFKTLSPKTWAPMVNYGLVTVAMGGMMSPLFIQEYEVYRLAMEKFFPEHAPPSLLEISKNVAGFFDRVEVDQELVQKAVTYGIPAALTGVDIASSTRANETFLTIVGGIIFGNESFLKIHPALGNLAQTAGGTIGTIKDLAGKNLGKEPNPAVLRKNMTDMLPAGAIAYGMKELAGVNETKIAGKDAGMVAGGTGNEAQIPRGTAEKIAGVMGTKSTAERMAGDMYRNQSMKEKNLTERKKGLYDTLVTLDPTSPNSEKILKKLIELGEDERAIENNLSSEAWKRMAPVVLRMFVDKRGNAPATMKTLRTLKGLDSMGYKPINRE